MLNLGLVNKSTSTLLFVHGYNVSFADAAKRTAQMAYDLNFSGVPLFFSWPANGKVLSYAADEASVEWSEPALYDFLVDHLSNSKIEQTFLIAHSMGNRAVLSSLARLKLERPDLRYKLKEVVLAAPDVDAEQFVDIIVPKIADPKAPVTLYASSRDKALLTSKKLHYYERAGDVPEIIKVYGGVEFIDASAVKTDFLNHSYMAESRSVISDILDLFGGSRPASRSGLRVREAQVGQYWEIK
ncbi:alpha/beta hydrolase [Pseudomonas sp. BF-R-24]|uniref:alpha/beta hydrolase n=1 Tax=Pseudomonas sp. BF-R-24 TaxID=2832386 RepID=UPI003989F3E2